jgi:hypothetical protein
MNKIEKLTQLDNVSSLLSYWLLEHESSHSSHISIKYKQTRQVYQNDVDFDATLDENGEEVDQSLVDGDDSGDVFDVYRKNNSKNDDTNDDPSHIQARLNKTSQQKGKRNESRQPVDDFDIITLTPTSNGAKIHIPRVLFLNYIQSTIKKLLITRQLQQDQLKLIGDFLGM